MSSSSQSQVALKAMAQSCAKKLMDVKDRIEYFEELLKHIVINKFFPEELADMCLSKFSELDHPTRELVNDPYSASWVKRNLLNKCGNKIRDFK